MGIYDREYFQDEDAPRGYSLSGQQRMMVTNVVLVTILVFVADTLMSGRISQWLALDLTFYQRPWQVYQLLSYGFVHAGAWHVGLNMFMLWMFGRIIEQRMGRQEFLLFYLTAIIVAGLAWVVWGNASCILQGIEITGRQVVVGASGGVVAVFIMFVLYYPKETVYIWGLVGVPAWVIGMLVIGQDVVRALMGAQDVTAWEAHLGGAAFAFLYLRLGLRLSRLLPASGTSGWKLPGRGPKLRIHDPEHGGDDQLAAEADRILAKVHREGEQSLTSGERRTLEKYSRRVRNQRREDN